jgi:hypothetical protein
MQVLNQNIKIELGNGYHTGAQCSGLLFIPFIILLFFSQGSTAQNTPFPPPNQLQVFDMQALNFGSFSAGTGAGTVEISPQGVRSSTGSVILMGGFFNQAIFEIKLIPGRLVQIMLGPPATLYRIGGGGTMLMTVGPADRGDSFVTDGGHPFFNPVQVGGTLTVGNTTANPPGDYEGQFSVTFIQE